MNDNTLAWAIEEDDFSSIDFWGSLLTPKILGLFW
jgi:hypothetical protein